MRQKLVVDKKRTPSVFATSVGNHTGVLLCASGSENRFVENKESSEKEKY